MKKYLIGFVKNTERVEKTLAELERVGAGEVEVIWGFPNPFDKELLSIMPHSWHFDKNIGFFNASVNHYRAVKTAYELGYDSVMVFEDDIRFRKDVDNLDSVLASAPEYDVLLLDGIFPRNGEKTKLTRICDGFSEFESMRSAACYVLSRAGMERIIWLYESAVNPNVRKRKARVCDQWFERSLLGDLKLVMATPNMAVQQNTPGGHNSGNKWRLAGYDALGIDLENYMPY